MPSIKKFRFRRGQMRPRRVVPEPPGEVMGVSIGWDPATELSAKRTELQTAAADGGQKELFQRCLTEMGTILTGSTPPTPPTKGNYFSQDAGFLCRLLADFACLQPEHSSWASAGITWPSVIDTAQKCADLSYNVWRYSTRTANLSDQKTPYEWTLGITTANSNAHGDSGPDQAPHVWRHPAQPTTATVYIWRKIRAMLNTTQRDDLDAAILSYADAQEPLASISHAAPQIVNHTSWNNQAVSLTRWLGVPGLRTVLGFSGLSDAQAAIVAAAELKHRTRTHLELSLLYMHGGASATGFHEGTGYGEDNATGVARLALWTRTIDEWAETSLHDFLEGCAETFARETIPGTNNPWTMNYGLVSGVHYRWGPNTGIPHWTLVMTAMQRLGMTEAAGHIKWMFEQHGVPFTDIGNGVTVPTEILESKYVTAFSDYLICGALGSIQSTELTALSTNASALGFRIWNNRFAAPSHQRNTAKNTLYFIGTPECDYDAGGHAHMDDYTLNTALWTRGGYIWSLTAGMNKPGFGRNKSPQPGHPRVLHNDRPVTTFASTSAHPGMAGLSNASTFRRVGYRYADDPDHPNGGYVGFCSVLDHANHIPSGKQTVEFFANPDKDLFIEFYRVQVASTAKTYLIRKVVPTLPTAVDGTFTKMGFGVWKSDDTTTVQIVNDSGGMFQASHNGQTQTWPDAHAKAFVTISAASEVEVWLRGYDPEYQWAALRETLELQQLGRDSSTFGRPSKSLRRGLAACYTTNDVVGGVAANRRIYLESVLDENGDPRALIADDLTNPQPAAICFGNGTAAPTYRTITSVDTTTSPMSVVVSSNTSISQASKQNFDLLNQTATDAEFCIQVVGTVDDVANAERIRRIICGYSLWIMPPLDATQPIDYRTGLIAQTGDNDDTEFTSPATVTRIEGTGCTGFDVADPKNVIVVFNNTFPNLTSAPTVGYAGFTTPTTDDREVTLTGLPPGDAYSFDLEASGSGYAITISASGGEFTVNNQGRVTFKIESGAIVPV
jgi:hypothetical protein